MVELTEAALRPTVDELYAALHDAKARLFREDRVCVEPELACELRAEIGRLTDAIRRQEAAQRGNRA